MSASVLLSKLKKARWTTALRTFGSDHATLIGILVDWWITLNPSRHTVLESGPSDGYPPGKRGHCDALLCKAERPIGVVEVEGSRKLETAHKIGRFFDARYPEIASLEFGILACYAYEPRGRGVARGFETAVPSDVIAAVKRITRDHPRKSVILVSVEKEYARLREGIRARNEYYMGTPRLIEGRAFASGSERARQVLCRGQPAN